MFEQRDFLFATFLRSKSGRPFPLMLLPFRFVFYQGFQTLKNNNSTRPSASHFHQFSRVCNPGWNTKPQFIKYYFNQTWSVQQNTLLKWILATFFAILKHCRSIVRSCIVYLRNQVIKFSRITAPPSHLWNPLQATRSRFQILTGSLKNIQTVNVIFRVSESRWNVKIHT